MKSFFPEIEQEIREDRKAYRREQVQYARNRLRKVDISPAINYLLEHGPTSEANLTLNLDDSKKAFDALLALHDLWRVGKLWRISLGIHPQVGEESFLYGIKGVHKKDK